MYYQVVGESRNSYTRLVFLNELISGQDIAYIDHLIGYENEPELRFDQNHCCIGLLGLKKSVYAGYYHLTTNQYMELYVIFEQRMNDYLERHQCSGEIFLNLYGDKQIIIIFSTGTDSEEKAKQILWYAQNSLQVLYEEQFLLDGVYCNQTFYSKLSLSREELPEAYRELSELNRLSYFLDKPMIYNYRMAQEIKPGVNKEEIRELRQKIFQAVNDCDHERCRWYLEELLLDKIKPCCDFYQLEETLVYLKRFYLQCCSAYDIPAWGNADEQFDYGKYPKIEQLTRAIGELLKKCMDPEVRSGRQYGRIVREAIQILKANYQKPDLSLTYVAQQLNISPGYLSSTFNRETAAGITKYIMTLRLQKGRELLEQTGLSVREVAAAVGILNKRYFSEQFKTEFGVTPKDYRLEVTPHQNIPPIK